MPVAMPMRTCSCGADVRLEIGDGIDQREPGARCLLGIVLVGLGITEIGEHAIPHVPRDDALAPRDDLRDAGVIGADDRAQILRIQSGRKCRRAHQIAKHDRELASLGAVPRHRSGGRLSRCEDITLEVCDHAQQLAPVPEQDAEVLEVLLREVANDGKVDGILGETLGVLAQTDRCEPLCSTCHGIPMAYAMRIAHWNSLRRRNYR